MRHHAFNGVVCFARIRRPEHSRYTARGGNTDSFAVSCGD